MRVILNIIWLVLAGLWLALGYLVAALLMAVLIVTLPFARQAIKLAHFALWPFGRSVIKAPTHSGASTVGNVLWVVLCGWWLALGHIVTAFFQAITIIGLPLAYANVKMVPMTLVPFGRQIVPTSDLQYVPGSQVAVAFPDDPAP